MPLPDNIPADMEREINEKGGIESIISNIPNEKSLEKIAGIHQALSDSIRLKIMFFLHEQRACVCLLRQITSLAYSKLSYHLKILRDANLITYEKNGNYAIYSLTDFGRFCVEKCVAASGNYNGQLKQP